MAVGVVLSGGAQAAPGGLDLTFSGDGKQRTEFDSASSRPEAIARQPDGKIVAVGTVAGYGANDFALARYNPDGTLDPSFSGDGRQTTDFGPLDQAYGVAIQGDGKIVAVGSTGARGDFALARYNPNGTLDPSFSGDGRQTTNLANDASARGVAIQGDGKIVAVGFACSNSCGFGLARYNPNGSLDSSFSGDGRQTTNFANDALAFAVALQGDGKIVAVGETSAPVADNFALARYNPNGSLDPSFSGDGRQTTDFGGEIDWARDVAIQGDGKIVAVGVGAPGGDFALARYNTNGSLDTSFSGDGKQTTDFGSYDQAEGVAIQGDGKIVAVGLAGGGATGNDFALARYNPNGALDPTFSGDGRQRTNFGIGANGVTLQGDGKIVAVGRAIGGAFGLARYNTDGSLDTSFSGDGKQRTDFGSTDVATGVALQGDGKIVAVGGTGVTRPSDFGLARYNTDGSLDTSFSGDGMQTTPFGPFDDRAAGVALQGDGKIIAVGVAGGGDFGIARYNSDGVLDNSFNFDGRETTDFGGSDQATGVALQGDGKIIVVGVAGGELALARYNVDGSLDTSFSGDGKQTTDFGGLNDGATGVAIQSDGKIVAVGKASVGDFALARYNANGSLDTSFSGDGKQTTDFGGNDGAAGVALQGDGKVIAIGRSGGDFALARYNPSGTLDTTFSGDGRQTTDFGGSDQANGVTLQPDGKIVAVGSGGASLGGGFALARYGPSGTLDTTFSGDGRQTTDFGGTDGANGVALQDDGMIVAVGVGLGTYYTSDFALARYLGG